MNPNAVMHLVLPWAESFDDPRPVHVAKVVKQTDGRFDLGLWLRAQDAAGNVKPNRVPFFVPVRVGDPLAGPETPGVPYKVDAFGLTRIGPGVWVVSPSVWVEGAFHAFVVLHDVPEPAPFAP